MTLVKPLLHKMTETMTVLTRAFFFIMLMLSVTGPVNADPAEQHFYRVETSKSYADVMQDLAFAIGSNNFRQTSRNTIGAAIRHRNKDKFEEATVVHFCNLEYARRLLEVSTDYLIHMPCRVAVWQAGASVFLEVKLVPDLSRGNEAEVIALINRTLIKIVDQSVERWSGNKD